MSADGPSLISGVSGDAALEIVMNERRKELMFVGTRAADIRRLNTFYNANISVSHLDKDGNIVTLSPNDPKWTLAIPLNIITMRPAKAKTCTELFLP